MIGRLELDRLISAKRCRERDLVVAVIVQRLLAPCSKLATSCKWHTTTLAEEMGVAEATEDDLYEAMDWLFPAPGAHREEDRGTPSERGWVECGANGCRVIDKKSTNGAFLDDVRNQEATLATDEEIRSGQTVSPVKIVACGSD